MKFREEKRQAYPGETIKSLVNVDAMGRRVENPAPEETLVIEKGQRYTVAQSYSISGTIRLADPRANLLLHNYVVVVE